MTRHLLKLVWNRKRTNALLVLGAISRSGLIPYADLRLNGRIFLDALFLTLFFGLLSGVYPAWRMSRLNPVEALARRSR